MQKTDIHRKFHPHNILYIIEASCPVPTTKKQIYGAITSLNFQGLFGHQNIFCSRDGRAYCPLHKKKKGSGMSRVPPLYTHSLNETGNSSEIAIQDYAEVAVQSQAKQYHR
jgi:hypothetical protein